MSEDWSKTIFREEADELLAELETTLLELDQAPGDSALVNRVFRALHTIKGSGAMFGFDEIARFTHEVETLFDRVRSGTLVVTRELLNASFRSRDHIKNLLADTLSDEEKKTEANAIRAELEVAAAGGTSCATPGEDADDDREAPESSAREEFRSFQVRIRPRTGTLPSGYPLGPLFEELEALGKCVVEHHGKDTESESWTVTLETDREEDDVRDVFFFAEVDLDVAIAADGAEAVFDISSDSAVEAGHGGQDASVGGSAPASGESVWREKPASSLRVSSGKLDKLVDLVGELVIIQSQLSQLAARRQDAPLTSLSEQLERLSEELRDTTLEVRMVPIGVSFSKFRRLVRDLGGELGKDVELVTAGAETELDKTVVERLADPLIHLVRNAMDHGIEPPVERLRQGKPEQGVIRISAEHSGGEVLIRMEDDGRGIDTGSIRTKAVELGLLEEGEDLPERELFRFLFEPGFTTAGAITNLSGRGVGMDVVGQAIQGLRGSIDISSEPGKGTSITIRLPLTLAIIDGLQVRSGDEHYVIPLSLVQECVELTSAQRREDEGRRLMDMRGEIVPYVSLREWFEIPGERPEVEHVVVTQVDKSRVGFVVDDVVGEHQTVIKTLGRVYRDVEGLSGATIRGDGSIALILDIPGLVRRVVQEGG